MKALPSNQALWERNKERGLHVFLVEAQGGTKEDLEAYAKQKGLTLPIAVRNDCDFSKYKGGNGLPYAFVVGPDGKVVWQGRDGYASVIAKQLDRIIYPGLGKLEVAPECVKSATEFANKNYGKAYEEALKVKEKEADNEAAIGDAEYIIKKIDSMVESMNTKVDTAIEKRRYLEAIRTLEELSGKGFKGMDEVQEKAEARLEEIEDDDSLKDEIKAWEKLEKTLEANEKAKTDAQRRANLIKFWEKNEGTAAADEAKALADALEG